MKAISLFACGGIGDLALRSAGFDVVVANEILEDRAEVFKKNFPESKMIIGDILSKKDEILSIAKECLEGNVLDIVFATPPCQGMSKNGRGKLLNLIRQGAKCEIDERNLLVIPTVEIFLRSGAHTLIMENVPEMENTVITDPNNDGCLIGIVDYVKRELGPDFESSVRVVEFANYGVPQSRLRLISIFTKNENLKKYINRSGSLFPPYTHRKDGEDGLKWVTVRDIISKFPALDAGSKEKSNDSSIDYHRVPLLDADKYFWVSNTPPENGAFNNQCVNKSCLYQGNQTHGSAKDESGINRASVETPIYCIKCGSLLPRPWVKDGNGYRLMKGYTSAYRRMSWDSPASTLTCNLSYACSDNKLHPSQNRVLSLYEAMHLHTVNKYEYKFERADKKKVSDKLIRELIGESIPPAGLEKIFVFIKSIASGEFTGKDNNNKRQQELLLS